MPGRAVTHSQIVNDDFSTEIASKRFQMRVLTGKPTINENDVKAHPWLMLGDNLQMPRWDKPISFVSTGDIKREDFSRLRLQNRVDDLRH